MASCATQPLGMGGFQTPPDEAEGASERVTQCWGCVPWQLLVSKDSCKTVNTRDLENLRRVFGLVPVTQCQPDRERSVDGTSP